MMCNVFNENFRPQTCKLYKYLYYFMPIAIIKTFSVCYDLNVLVSGNDCKIKYRLYCGNSCGGEKDGTLCVCARAHKNVFVLLLFMQ